MNREQALYILCAFQEWRRYDGPIGEGPIMPCPKEIGQALDIAIDIMQGKEQAEKPLYSFEILKAMKISDEITTARAKHLCQWLNIETVADLACWMKNEIIRTRGLGKRTFQELTDVLTKYGLTWGMYGCSGEIWTHMGRVEKEKLNA